MKSVLAVPLHDDGQVTGVIEIYAAERERFGLDDIAMLTELAEAASFGITSHRIRGDGDRARADLHETARQLHTLLDNFPDLVARMDPQGRILYLNPAVRRIFRSQAEGVIGMEPADRDVGYDAETRRAVAESVLRVAAGGSPETLDAVLHTPDGPRAYEIRHFPELDDSGNAISVLCIARDTTERKAAEAAVLQRERTYRNLAEHTPDLIVRWDPDLRRVYVNPAFAEMIPHPMAEILGSALGQHYPEDVRSEIAPQLLELEKWVRSVFATGEPLTRDMPWFTRRGRRSYDLRIVPERDDDGTIATVLGIGRDITAHKESEREARTLSDHSPDFIARFDAEGRYLYLNKQAQQATGLVAAELIGRRLSDFLDGHDDCPDFPSLRQLSSHIDTVRDERRPFETELPLPVAGGPMKLFNVRLIPELDDTGGVTTILMIARDITDRRTLEDQLRQAQKMEAVGQLAGGIAHDFNNMLAVILLQASRAGGSHTSASGVRDALHMIVQTTERATRLTHQLLTFSRRQVPRMIELDLREVVANVSNMLRRVIAENITIEARYRGGLPPVLADLVMMEQVVMNLGINARDAMPDGGTLMLELAGTRLSEAESAAYPGRKPGRYVRLTVSDTGSGIAPADLPRIFEPFFTTKEVGKGTGLGLATVFGIVEQHDGWIDVESTPPNGARFSVFLPASDSGTVVRVRAESVPAPSVRGGNETILLVEDEDAVRSAVRQTLENYGYRVVEATSAAGALVHFESEATSLSLLLTDLIMPGGMSGLQLAQHLLATRPQLKVVFMSGYGADLSSKLLEVESNPIVLQKPFAPELLAACVRRCLDAPGD